MARFDSAIALALRLITKNGQAITLRHFTPGAPPDTDKPWVSGEPTPVDQDAVGVFLAYDQKYIDGETIRRGDQRVYIAADGVTTDPQLDGTILRGSEVWKIVNVGVLSPNGQKIMYDVQVRQ